MAATTTVPVTITPEARDFARKQGCEREMARMLEYTQHTVTDLQQIVVKLFQDPEEDDQRIIIEAYQWPVPEPETDRTQQDWDKWVIQALPWQVTQHFCFMTMEGETDEGQSLS